MHPRALVLALCLFFVSSCKSPVNPTFEPGSLAPDFGFQVIGGGHKRLSDYRGKRVVLHFWASWCQICKGELPVLDRASKRIGTDAVIIAVGVMDQPDAIKAFVGSASIPYLAVLPDESDLPSLYKVGGVPESFLIDEDGRFVLLSNPDSGRDIVRIVGPLRWDAPSIIAQVAGRDT